MPEAEEVEVNIDPNELRIDVYRSTGHGGQSVNTTDSAVRITRFARPAWWLPCQDEKSQLKNKAKAARRSCAPTAGRHDPKQNAEQAQTRKNQVGSGDRSERIRTYNFLRKAASPITGSNLTRYDTDSFINGNIGSMIDARITLSGGIA